MTGSKKTGILNVNDILLNEFILMTKHGSSKPTGEIIFALHPIIELLKAKKRKISVLYTCRPEPKGLSSIKQLLPEHVNISYVSKEYLNQLAGTTDHQSVVAVAAPFIYRKKFFDPQHQPTLLMLDGIQDIRNLGAILRSAYCTGITGVIITQKHSAPINAAALKASAGLAEHLDIYIAPSAQAAALELKRAGYHLYITSFKGENALKVAYKDPLCVVIGSEGLGVTPAIMQEGTQVTIPQQAKDISYNASVAAGIMLFIISQRDTLT